MGVSVRCSVCKKLYDSYDKLVVDPRTGNYVCKPCAMDSEVLRQNFTKKDQSILNQWGAK